MKLFKSGAGAIAVLAVLASSPLAYALDGQDFGEKFSAMMGTGGMSVSFEAASSTGDSVTISNFIFGLPGYDQITIPGEAVFTGVRELGDGGYTAEKAIISNIEFSDDEVEISITDMVMTELVIPAFRADFVKGGIPTLEELQQSLNAYRTFSTGPVAVKIEGSDAFSIEAISSTSTVNQALTKVEFDFIVEGIQSNLSKLIPDQEAAGMLQLFDLETINAHMQAKGFWDVETGQMSFTENAITIDNVGRLDMAFEILGYDLDVMLETVKLQSELESIDASDVAEQDALDLKMMDVFADKLSFVSFAIDFQDDGITDKVLDFFSELQGVPREIMVAGFAAAVPAMAAEVGLPEDTQLQIFNAVAAYLTTPERLTISAKPEAPIKITIIGDAAEDPSALAKLLNVTISANQ